MVFHVIRLIVLYDEPITSIKDDSSYLCNISMSKLVHMYIQYIQKHMYLRPYYKRYHYKRYRYKRYRYRRYRLQNVSITKCIDYKMYLLQKVSITKGIVNKSYRQQEVSAIKGTVLIKNIDQFLI